MFTFKKESKGKQRALNPTAVFMCGNTDTEFRGYISLDKNENVRMCVHKIADTISNMTIMLMENSEHGDKRIYNDISRLVDISPNVRTTRKQFIYSIVQEMAISGNAVVFPNFRGMKLESLEVIAHKDYSFIPNGDSYKVRIFGKTYSPDEIIHFVFVPSREYPWRGVGYSETVLNMLKNIAQAQHTRASFLKSNWKPGLIISVNTDIEEMTHPEFRRKILSSYTADSEAGEPWLIPAGEISVEKVQPLSLRDLAIEESITLDLKSLAACMGVPDFMVGLGEYSSEKYNNFISTTIMSYATVIQGELTKKLLLSQDKYFKLNARSLMQYSLNEKMSFVRAAIDCGMLSRNEGRNEFDFSPVYLEGMDDYTTLENFLSLDDLSKQKKLIQDDELQETE